MVLVGEGGGWDCFRRSCRDVGVVGKKRKGTLEEEEGLEEGGRVEEAGKDVREKSINVPLA